MKIDEEVPTMIPHMIARPKPCITLPPISARGIERTTVKITRSHDKATPAQSFEKEKQGVILN